MSAAAPSSADDDDVTEDFGHPRGTLAIVIVFGLLAFGLAWLATYSCLSRARCAPVVSIGRYAYAG